MGSNFLGSSSSTSLVGLSLSRRPLPPRLRIEAAKNAQKPSFLLARSLARPQFVRPSVRLAFFLPDYDDDDDEGGGGGGGGDDAL